MKNLLISLDSLVAKLLDLLCIGLLTGLFALVSVAIGTRLSGFGSPAWTDEVVEFLLAWLIFLGAAGLWRSRGHFRVDLLDQLARDARTKRILALAVESLCILFLAVLTYYGALFAAQATDTSPTFSLSRFYWFAAMPVSSSLMLIYSLVLFWELCRGEALPASLSASLPQRPSSH